MKRKSIEKESRKLANEILGGIEYGDSRDNPKWRKEVTEATGRLIASRLRGMVALTGVIVLLISCTVPAFSVSTSWPYKSIVQFESWEYLDSGIEIYRGQPECEYEVIGVNLAAYADGYINPEKKVLELLVEEVIREGGDALINYQIAGKGNGLNNKAVGKGDIIKWVK